MKNIWFTSDQHFGHANIIEYEKESRPFNSVEEMNECLVDRWNSVVYPGDTVYCLGDFAFGRRNVTLYASRLNGKKRLVLGNHDSYPAELYLGVFTHLYGVKFWEDCLLSHVPVHPDSLGSRCFLNVHGHLHSKQVMNNWMKVPDKNYMCVSVEQNNLTPIHADVIRDRVKYLKEIE